jgi:hypothetical protein
MSLERPIRPAAPVTATGPIFLTGLSHSGKTEVRRVLERHKDVHMIRKAAAWEDIRSPAARKRAVGESAALASRAGSPRWGVQRKTLERHAVELLEELADATVIHLVRDPLASLGRRPGRTGWALAAWVASTRRGLRLADRWPDRYHLVRIEDIAADPAVVLRRVALAAGIGADPAVDEEIQAIDWTAFRSREVRATWLTSGVTTRLRSRLGYRIALDRSWVWGDVVDLFAFVAQSAVRAVRDGRVQV